MIVNTMFQLPNSSSVNNSLRTDLAAYWSFNSASAIDSVTNTIRNATAAGSVSTGSISSGRWSGNGSVGISIPYDSSLDLINAQSFTVASWITPRAASVTGTILDIGIEQIIPLGQNVTGSGAGFGLSLINNYLTLTLRSDVTGTMSLDSNTVSFTSSQKLSTATVHVAATFQNGIVKFYKNGVLTDTFNTINLNAQIFWDNNIKTTIGTNWKSNGSWGTYINCWIYELGYWKRCLSEDEIIQLYCNNYNTSYPPVYFSDNIRKSFNNSIISYLDFNNNLIDKVMLNNETPITHSSWTNPVYSTSSKSGSHCVSFNGTSDYIHLKTDPTKFISNNGITVSGWVYPILYSSYRTIFEVWDLATIPVGFQLYTNNGILEFAIGYGSGGGPVLVRASTALTINSYNHVAVTCDNKKIKLYLNGKFDGFDACSAIIWTGGNLKPVIGADNPYSTGYQRYWNGRIDELAYWGRTLNDNEIKELYNNGAGKFYDQF